MNQRALLGIIAALLLVVGVLIGLLVGGGGDDDSATENDTSTTSASPTTTASVTETTEAPTTTAAVTETTTTTTTTTTTPPATGVFVAPEGVLGWVTDGVLSANDAGPVPATAGDEYRLLRPEGVVGTAAGSAAEPGCFGDTPYIDIGVTADAWPFDFPIGVSGGWELFPQVVEVLPTDNATYEDATRDLLAPFGIDDPDPQLLQVLRVDLEGDGVDEVIVVAERLQTGELIGASEGDYSVAYLRKVIEGEVQEALLGFSRVQDLAEGEFGFIEVFRVPAVLDLDGDGQMEIVTQGFYYEGSWTEAWEYVDDDLGPVVTLTVGCGV